MLAMVSLVCFAADNNLHQYKELLKHKSDELVKLGNKCFVRGSIDSAQVCYSIVVNRHQHETSKEQRQLMHAYNNLGCVALCYLDYQRAYRYFTQTLALGEKYGITVNRLTAKLNLANMFTLNNSSRFSSRPMSTEAIARYDEIMVEAKQQKDWSVYMSGFIDLVELNPNIDLKKYE